jgi:hypothetical protein
MNTAYVTKFMTLALLAMITSPKVAAAEIYHWVDENGVPHYSQYRPGDDTPNVSTKKLEDTTPDQVEDVYNLEAHEKRMTAWREERDQERKETRERKRKIAEQQPIKHSEPYRDYSRSFWYPPIYNRPPHRPPNRPPHRPQPPVINPRPPSPFLPSRG